MKKYYLCFVVITWFTVVFVSLGQAQDNARMTETPPPEMIFEPSPNDCLVPEKVEVRFSSIYESEISFQIKNICEQDYTHKITFNGGYDDANIVFLPGSFKNIKLKVNGQEKNMHKEARATFKGKDITAQLEDQGIPNTIFEYADSLDDGELPALVQKYHLDNPNLKKFVDNCYRPMWKVDYSDWWEQTFPAKSTTTIQYSSDLLYGFYGQFLDYSDYEHPVYPQKHENVPDVPPCISSQDIMDNLYKIYGPNVYSGFDVTFNSVFLKDTTWKHPVGLLSLEYPKQESSVKSHDLTVSCVDGKTYFTTEAIKVELKNYNLTKQPRITFLNLSFDLFKDKKEKIK